jgi:hypothetical protein
MRTVLRAGILVVVTLFATASFAACGDDDSSSGKDDDKDTDATTTTADEDAAADGNDYVAALSAKLQDEDDGLGLDEAGATCLASAVVDVTGADALSSAGVSPDDFAEAEDLISLGIQPPVDAAATLTAAFEACNVVDQVKAGFAAFLDPDDPGTCVPDALDGQTLLTTVAQAFVDESTGGAQLDGLMTDALASCPADLTDLVILLFSTSPDTPPSEDEHACVEGVVNQDPRAVAEAVIVGDGDDDITTQMSAACPGF